MSRRLFVALFAVAASAAVAVHCSQPDAPEVEVRAPPAPAPQPQPSSGGDDGGGTPAPAPGPSQGGNPNGGGQGGGDPFDAVKAIVARDCGTCHNGITQQPDLSTGDAFKHSNAKARILNGTMPPNGSLNPSDKQALLKFLNS